MYCGADFNNSFSKESFPSHIYSVNIFTVNHVKIICFQIKSCLLHSQVHMNSPLLDLFVPPPLQFCGMFAEALRNGEVMGFKFLLIIMFIYCNFSPTEFFIVTL